MDGFTGSSSRETSARVPVPGPGWPATVIDDHGALRGTCLEISEDGIGLSLDAPAQPDTVVGIVLSVPGTGDLYGRARVAGESLPGKCLPLRWVGVSMRLACLIGALRAAHEARQKESMRLRRRR